MMLADLGADVIKVERPGSGDDNRSVISFAGRGNRDEDYFYPMNRSKRSIELDLRKRVDNDICLQLISSADVLIENFAPGVASRLGLDFDTCLARNERLVYLSISGFGQFGPYASWKAFDGVIQAMSGFMVANEAASRYGQPVRPGMMFGDVFAGMFGAASALAGLLRAQQDGRGVYLDIGMFETLASIWEHRPDDPLEMRRWTECEAEGALRYAHRVGESVPMEGRPPPVAVPIQTISDYLGSGDISNPDLLWELEHPVSGRIRVIGTAFGSMGDVRAGAFSPPLLGQDQDVLAREHAWLASPRDWPRSGPVSDSGVLAGVVFRDLTGTVAGRITARLLSDLGARLELGHVDPDHDGAGSDEFVLLTDSRTPSGGTDAESTPDAMRIHFLPVPSGYENLVSSPEVDDSAIQIVAGLARTLGVSADDWSTVDLPVASYAAALYAVMALLVWRLQAAPRASSGRYVEIVASDCLSSMWSTTAAKWLAIGEAPGPVGNTNPNRSPARSYRTLDGWVQLIAAGEAHWQSVCRELDLTHLLQRRDLSTNAGRVAARAEIDALLEPRFALKPTEHWVTLFAGLGVPIGPVNDEESIMDDAHLRARGCTSSVASGPRLQSPFYALPVGVGKASGAGVALGGPGC